MLEVNSKHQQNLIGSILMVVSMAAFSVEDSFLKMASQTLPIGQILMLFGVGGAVFFYWLCQAL